MALGSFERRLLIRLRAEDRLRWAVLGSAWVHFGMMVIFASVDLPARAPAPLRAYQIRLVTSRPPPPKPRPDSPPVVEEELSAPSPRQPAPTPAPSPSLLPRSPNGARPLSRAERRRSEVIDPVASFRASMDWRIEEPSGSASRNAAELEPRPEPTHWTPAAKVDDLVLTPYIQQLEALLGSRWAVAELPMRQRAMGIQGRVEVRYQIKKNGRIVEKVIVRSSGIADLDRIALETIPNRAPPLPKHHESLLHKVSFRYDNPLISSWGR